MSSIRDSTEKSPILFSEATRLKMANTTTTMDIDDHDHDNLEHDDKDIIWGEFPINLWSIFVRIESEQQF